MSEHGLPPEIAARYAPGNKDNQPKTIDQTIGSGLHNPNMDYMKNADVSRSAGLGKTPDNLPVARGVVGTPDPRKS